jgi:hypothetical protein
MNKTLIGKDGYLFLINDSCQELDNHCMKNIIIRPDLERYNPYKDKFLITIFPNKSFVQKEFLPNEYNPQYRQAFDIYKSFFGNHIFDGLSVVNNSAYYYKTDTHINLNGACLIYEGWKRSVLELFGLEIPTKTINLIFKKVDSLNSLNLGIGDLTWKSNLGNQTLTDISDTYYFSDSFELIYYRYIIEKNSKIRILNYDFNDCTDKYYGNIIDWSLISNNILYTQNENGIKKKVVIFYDSFLLSTLSLYLEIFSETYMIKNVYSKYILDRLKPDLVFEFRCERFL